MSDEITLVEAYNRSTGEEFSYVYLADYVKLQQEIEKLQAELAKHHDIPLLQKYADENEKLKEQVFILSTQEHMEAAKQRMALELNDYVIALRSENDRMKAVVDAARVLMSSDRGNEEIDANNALYDALKAYDEKGEGGG